MTDLRLGLGFGLGLLGLGLGDGDSDGIADGASLVVMCPILGAIMVFAVGRDGAKLLITR